MSTLQVADDTIASTPRASEGAFAPLDGAARRARERRRSVARRARQGLFVLALLAVGGLVAFAMWPKPVKVDVSEAKIGPLTVAIEETGITRVKDRFVVSAPVTGSLSRISLEPGDTVRQGDTLAEIAPALSPLLDPRSHAQAEARLGAALSAVGQAKAQAARAETAVRYAQQEFERVRKLTASGALAPQALDDAQFALQMRQQELSSAEFSGKVASEELRSAQVTLRASPARGATEAHVSVRAPASGQVLRVQQKSAGIVQSGAPLLEVGEPALLEVVVDLLTSDAVRVKLGAPVVVMRWGGDQDLAGRVRRVEPSGFTRPSALGVDEQRVNVIVALTDARSRFAELADGYRVEVRIVLWESGSTLKVPLGSVFRHGDGWATFRISDGRARLTRVELGHRGESEVEVLSGLAAGSELIEHPSDAVVDGARIEPR